LDVSYRNPESVLDMSVIESLRELGGEDQPELLAELIDLFLDDTPKQLQALDEAVEAAYPEGMERAAHTLKSSCANVGAMGMSVLCFELEKLGRSNAIEGAGSLSSQIQQAYVAVAEALEVCKS